MDKRIINTLWKKYFNLFSIAFFTGSFLCLNAALAQQYELKLLRDFSELNRGNTNLKWLDPISNPADDEELFVANADGFIYLLERNGTSKQALVLDINYEPGEKNSISLTSIALHPSFTRPEESGYATFYTAHIANNDNQKSTTLISQDAIDGEFPYQTVITAWQYNFAQKKIDLNSKRELLKIPIQALDGAINNLSFDPYQKTWGRGYGQLYFSLKASAELKEYPLYSGTILRINPNVFGARNYTIPEDNPFIDDPKVHDEIVVMGLENIEHYFWIKNKYGEMYIQHNYQQQYWLSKAKIGDDFKGKSEVSHLRAELQPISPISLYQGRLFVTLRNHFVSLFSKNNEWFLSFFSELNNLPSLSAEVLTKNSLTSAFIVDIGHKDNGRIFVFDMNNASLYELQLMQAEQVGSITPVQEDMESGLPSYLYYIALLIGAVIVFVVYQKNKMQATPLVSQEKNQLRLKYVANSKTIFLYQSSMSNVIKTFPLENIICCKLLLNNNVLVTIDGQTKHAFTILMEQNLRTLFTDEHYEKMQSNETRTIELLMTDKNETYTACIYFRKGKHRATGAKFHEVVDIVLDLCWDLSLQINPEITENRITPSTENIEISRRYYTAPVTQEERDVGRVDTDLLYTDPKNSKTGSRDVADALEKLAKLHQNGLLTDEEFTVAKSKLLN